MIANEVRDAARECGVLDAREGPMQVRDDEDAKALAVIVTHDTNPKLADIDEIWDAYLEGYLDEREKL